MYDNMAHNTSMSSDGTSPLVISALEKGSYAMFKGQPCQIVEIATSNSNGVSITGVDIFSGKKIEVEGLDSDTMVECPRVTTSEYELVSVEGGSITVMFDDGAFGNIDLPSDNEDDNTLTNTLKEKNAANYILKVTVIATMGKQKIVSFREIKD
jgi:translation elongation factor P/translation initiation factor 5A